MIFRCKICGGETAVDALNGIMTCEYCGTKQALPLFSDDSERLLYESGNSYLSHNEYDKAETVFNQLLTIKPNAAELYWALVLCKYGVAYVKDPKSQKYIPTCNRTHYSPVFSDKNYQKAIELAEGEKKALFEDDAKTIDNIQKGIIAISKKEKPFDIFISYKETDANGNRTKDSVEAQKLYEKLTEAGYKVFFSRITLEDKIGTEYEPYIYAALYSSKVMITVSSSKENIDAVWVKNEWSRFLSLRQNDSTKTLLPLYFDMDKADLPEEFAIIPSFNIKDVGFEAELLRGVKKLIPLPIMLAKKREATKKTIRTASLSVLAVVAILCIMLLPGAIKNHINGNKYDEAMQLFGNQKYTEARQIFETILSYKDSEYMVERCDRQPSYDVALQLYSDGSFAQSAWAFGAISDYEDAADMQKKAEDAWRNSLAIIYTDDCYITENGSVNTLKGVQSNSHSKIDVIKNGKVKSIISNSFYSGFASYLTAIHDGGYVSHPKFDNSDPAIAAEWHDIIKVSDAFRGTTIAGLRADGKMVVISSGTTNKLAELTEWENIVDFKENYSPGNGYNEGLIIGLKADGTLCVTQYSDNLEYSDYNMYEVNNAVKKFTNVKSFALDNESKIVALTNDNKLLTYADGNFTTSDGEDICDIVSTNIVLKNNGDLVSLKNNKVLLRDIAYARGGFAITRNGNINLIKQTKNVIEISKTDSKTTVYEEWISRLN